MGIVGRKLVRETIFCFLVSILLAPQRVQERQSVRTSYIEKEKRNQTWYQGRVSSKDRGCPLVWPLPWNPSHSEWIGLNPLRGTLLHWHCLLAGQWRLWLAPQGVSGWKTNDVTCWYLHFYYTQLSNKWFWWKCGAHRLSCKSGRCASRDSSIAQNSTGRMLVQMSPFSSVTYCLPTHPPCSFPEVKAMISHRLGSANGF